MLYCMSVNCKAMKGVKILREANGLAKCLAKAGVDRVKTSLQGGNGFLGVLL